MLQQPIRSIRYSPHPDGATTVVIELSPPDQVLTEEEAKAHYGVQIFSESFGILKEGHGFVTTLSVKARTSPETSDESN